jgi:regulator of nonsense transcripts 2
MKTQQAAEREEQQRIKNLVLNYDLRDGEDQDGDSLLPTLLPNPNIHEYNTGIEKAAGATYSRTDKSSNNRSGQRARKLQLSDVDWYDSKHNSSQSENTNPYEKKDGLVSCHIENGSPSVPPGRGLIPSVAASRSFAGQQRVIAPARATAQVGRLTRKQILQEHESRKLAWKVDTKM